MKHFVLFFLSGIVVLLLVAHLFAQWEPEVRLTSDSAKSTTTENNTWCVAAEGNYVHVVWSDGRGAPNSSIFYKRSTDSGTSWSADQQLTDDPALSLSPGIAFAGTNDYIVWADTRDLVSMCEIYFKRSTNNGSLWLPDERLSFYEMSAISPCVAATGSYVHVVWTDGMTGNDEIFYVRSTDGGLNWGGAFRLSDSPDLSSFASIATYGSYVHVAWKDSRDGTIETYYKRSADHGLTWSADIRLTTPPTNSGVPSIAAEGSHVYVTWHSYGKAYFIHSGDNGATWDTEVLISGSLAEATCPNIAASGNNVHVVWVDSRDSIGIEIYYDHSSDNGLTWDLDVCLTANDSLSETPSVAVSGTGVHVVWDDYRNGGITDEIYYKRNPTGNAVAEETEHPRLGYYEIGKLTVSPNPFGTATTITLSLPNREHRAEDIELNIFDVRGRHIRSLLAGDLCSGALTWDGRDNEGKEVNAGVYFVKIKDYEPMKVTKLR